MSTTDPRALLAAGALPPELRELDLAALAQLPPAKLAQLARQRRLAAALRAQQPPPAPAPPKRP